MTKRQQEKKMKEQEEYVMRLIDGDKEEKVEKVDKVSTGKKNRSARNKV